MGTLSSTCTWLALGITVGLLAFTAYRMAARFIHFPAIDYEVSQGYATDRWGHGPPDTYDDGEVWGTEQKNMYDRKTRIFQVLSLVAVIILAASAFVRRRCTSDRLRLDCPEPHSASDHHS